MRPGTSTSIWWNFRWMGRRSFVARLAASRTLGSLLASQRRVRVRRGRRGTGDPHPAARDAGRAGRRVSSGFRWPARPDEICRRRVLARRDEARVQPQLRIWISPSNGGAPAKLTSESGEFAAEWSPDGAWIAFNYARPFFRGLVKVRVGAGEPEVRLRTGICGPTAPAWSPDGAWIACGRPPMGLDLVPANGGPPRFLGQQYEPLAAWSRDPDRLYVIRTSEGRRALGELIWRSGAFRPISPIPADFEINSAISWGGRLSLSHDGKSLVTAVSRATGDIWILDGLRPPRTWWQLLLGR
jgi:dipeptidyl aminopeptidase/acylaminoacyl peptidase